MLMAVRRGMKTKKTLNEYYWYLESREQVKKQTNKKQVNEKNVQ